VYVEEASEDRIQIARLVVGFLSSYLDRLFIFLAIRQTRKFRCQDFL
jgi:hypothetical protein